MGWLITLGVLLLLAIVPLGVRVRYQDAGLTVRLLAGPLGFRVFPGKKKDAAKSAEKKKTGQKPPKKKKQTAADSQKKKGGSFTDFLPLVEAGLALLDGLRRKLRIDHLELKLILAGDDPCDLAVSYGRTWAAIGSLMPQLERCFVIKKRNIEAECDFEASETLVIARADITITLGRLLGLLGYRGVKALMAYTNFKKIRKGGAVK